MPREEWTEKQERKYEHIKRSQEQQGKPARRAKEVAARTVQKERARTGQAKSASRTSRRDMPSSRRGGQRSGTRRPKGRTKQQLYEEAKRRGVEGRSRMTKEQLQRALAGKRGWSAVSTRVWISASGAASAAAGTRRAPRGPR